MRRLFFAISILALGLPAIAQATGAWTTLLRTYRFNDLLADGDTVWCATLESGLLRYGRDARRFEPIVHEPGGLASNHLTALTLDASRRLWIGTIGAGASVLSPDRSSWKLVNTFDGLPSDSVTSFEAEGDTLWIGTTAGLAFWNGTEIAGALPDGAHPSPFASNSITGIEVLADTIWVATQDGLYRTRVSLLLGHSVAAWTRTDLGFTHASIRALASAGGALFGLDSVTVRRYDPASGTWIAINGAIGSVQALSDDRERLTVASGRGLFAWNGAGWDTITTTLTSPGFADPRQNFARDFVTGVDASGRVVAANLTGLYDQPAVGDRGPWDPHLPIAPPGNDVRNLVVDRGRLYVNTNVEGVGRYDGTSWKYWLATLPVDESDSTLRKPLFAWALPVGPDGRKWIACWDFALDVLDDSGTSDHVIHNWARTYPVTPPDTVRVHTWAWSSSLDANGGLWFGMDPNGTNAAIGLERYDAAGTYVANYQPANSGMRGSDVHGLTVDKNGQMWVGYKDGGIDLFVTPVGNAAPSFRAVDNTDNLKIFALAAHGDAVWALTSRELQRYKLTGDLELSYDLPDPPTDLAGRPLEVGPDGTVWIATTNGLYVLGADGVLQHIDVDNSPLASNEVRAVQVDPANGKVWIGTGEGLNQFDPHYVATPLVLPQLTVKIYPNPAHLSALGIGLRVAGNSASLEGEVVDITGRVVRRFTTRSVGQVMWDGRDTRGALVKPGLYFVRAVAAGRVAVARVVLLH